MTKKFQRIICLLLIFTSIIGFTPQDVRVLGQNEVIVVENYDKITLEDGTSVTESELSDRLANYSGEVQFTQDAQLEEIASIINKNNPEEELKASISIGDALKVMAGTWYIPGIGKIVIVGGAILIGGYAIYKISGWFANKIANWIRARALSKQVDDAINKINNNDRNHILQPKHKWNKLFPNDPLNDPKLWGKVLTIIRATMMNGKEEPYGSVLKRVATFGPHIVEVTFRKYSNGVIKISNAWVVK